MGTINLAAKYASVVDERFKLGALTTGMINNNFNWIGVKTVKVFSRDLATLNDYTVGGSNRYGSPDDLGNAVQEMTITQDKSFTYVIDASTEQDTNGTMEAGASLAENIDNLLIPAIDKYRLAVAVAKAPVAGTVSGVNHTVVKAVTSSNAYEEFLAVQEILDNDKVPVGGRICFCTPKYHNLIKLDPNFTKKGDLATQISINGLVGMIDNVPVVKVPTSYFVGGVDFIITNPIAMPSPIKLEDFKIHYDAPGISGALIEARVRFDAFVLDKKADAIGVHRHASIVLDKSTLTVADGATGSLSATTLPDGGATVNWSSSNSLVATVANGTVTGVDPGTCVITAKNGDAEATCVVTVTA